MGHRWDGNKWTGGLYSCTGEINDGTRGKIMQRDVQAATIAGALIPTMMDVLIPRSTLRVNVLVDAGLVTGFALFTALFAQIAIRIPTTTVPITGQTLAVLLTGAALGSRRGALSMSVYTLLGMFIFPAFAPPAAFMSDKIIHFVLPWSGASYYVWDAANGGYILGFILASYLVGLLAEWGWDRRTSIPLVMLVGNAAVYFVGLPVLALYIAFGTIPGLDLTYYDAIAGNNVLDKTLKGGLYPFIGGDAIKLVMAALAVPIAWVGIRRLKGEGA